jgi:hypothetical protein
MWFWRRAGSTARVLRSAPSRFGFLPTQRKNSLDSTDPRRRTALDELRAQVWYRACCLSTGLQRPKELQDLFLGTSAAEKSSGAWEQYREGARTPSFRQNAGTPEPLVQLVGKRYPQTELLFFHPIWNALDPTVAMDVATVNGLLLQVDPRVSDQFIRYSDDQAAVRRDWSSVQGMWDFPFGGPLSADFLAAYLLLYREARAQQRDDVYEHGAVQVIDAVKEMRASPLWAPFRRQLLVHVVNSFVASEVGP